jgi:hypothetical protein
MPKCKCHIRLLHKIKTSLHFKISKSSNSSLQIIQHRTQCIGPSCSFHIISANNPTNRVNTYGLKQSRGNNLHWEIVYNKLYGLGWSHMTQWGAPDLKSNWIVWYVVLWFDITKTLSCSKLTHSVSDNQAVVEATLVRCCKRMNRSTNHHSKKEWRM